LNYIYRSENFRNICKLHIAICKLRKKIDSFSQYSEKRSSLITIDAELSSFLLSFKKREDSPNFNKRDIKLKLLV